MALLYIVNKKGFQTQSTYIGTNKRDWGIIRKRFILVHFSEYIQKLKFIFTIF